MTRKSKGSNVQVGKVPFLYKKNMSQNTKK